MMNRTIYKVKRLLRLFSEQGVSGLLYRLRLKLRVPAQSVSVSHSRPTEEDLLQLKRRIEALDSTPLISIVTPVYNPPVAYLREAIESVLAQVYANWELCIADDASTDGEVLRLLKSYEEQDSRIRVVYRRENGHIAKASQGALELASGEYVALLDHDDLLSADALARIAVAVAAEREPLILYSNEAKSGSDGRLFEVTDKPDWSPQYFYRYMYTGHLTVYSKSLLDRAGGFQAGFEGSQDYELMLRVLKQGCKVLRLPEVLYYWRECEGSVAGDRFSKLYAYEKARHALNTHLPEVEPAFCGIEEGIYPGVSRVRFRVPADVTTETRPFDSSTSVSELFLPAGESTYLYFEDRTCRERSSMGLRHMLEAIQASGVVAVTPLILERGGVIVESAGSRITEHGLTPRFSGLSAFEGGPGMQLATGGEVAGCSLSHMLVCASVWNEFIEQYAGKVRDLQHLGLLFCDSMTEQGKCVYYCPQAVFLRK